MRTSVARKNTILWQACADLVRDSYAKKYGAVTEPSPDYFIALCEDGPDIAGPLACAGVTHAGARPLLVEHYLGSAAHEALTAFHGERVDPHTVVEVGSLAARSAGAGLGLVQMLPGFCWCNGAQFAVCTITQSLVRALARVGIEFVPLADARESDLPGELQGCWGSYYDTSPVTGFVDIRGFDAVLARSSSDGYRLLVTGSRERTSLASQVSG